MLTTMQSSHRPGRTDWTSIFAACGVGLTIIRLLVVHPVR